jgi:hypothetical protein
VVISRRAPQGACAMATKYKSDITGAVHRAAADSHRAGVMD